METLRVSERLTLRAAGASLTYRSAYPAANGLSRIFEGIGIALWRYVYPLDSILGSPVPGGAAIGAIRPPPNVMGSNPGSPRRRHSSACPPFDRSRAYVGGSVPPKMQRSLAREKTVGAGAVEAPTSLPIRR